MKRLVFVLAFLISACFAPAASQPTSTASVPFIFAAEENPHAPKPDDDRLSRVDVILTSVNLSERTDLTPVRVQVNLSGSMPGACNEFRAKVNPPDKEYHIYIEAYSVTDPAVKCQDVFQQFETNILLGVYSPGRYFTWVNDVYVGDFVVY
jgi:hypothetical protein